MKKLSKNLLDNIDITINLGDKKKIVLIETSEISGLDNHSHNANIYCLNDDDTIVWQVDSNEGIMDKDSFVYIEKKDDGIFGQRFFGTEYMIEESSGKSKKTGWNK